MKTCFSLVLCLLVSSLSTFAQQPTPTPLRIPKELVGKAEASDPFWICIYSDEQQYPGPPGSSDRFSYCNELGRIRNSRPAVGWYPDYYYRPYPSYGNYAYYGGYYGYGIPPFLLDPCQSYLPENSQNVGCTTAEIKFKVLNRGLGDQVMVRIDGVNAGMIGQYSKGLTSGLRLRADKEYTMELLWIRRDGPPKTIVDRIKPLNMRMQDGPYWYPVSKSMFEEAGAPYGRDVVPQRERIGGKPFITGGY